MLVKSVYNYLLLLKKEISIFPPHSEHGHKQANRCRGRHHSGLGGDFWRHRVGNRVSIFMSFQVFLFGSWCVSWPLVPPPSHVVSLMCLFPLQLAVWCDLDVFVSCGFLCSGEPSPVWNNVGHNRILGCLACLHN